MALTGNKGEWSEIYVLIKLLADLKLFSANESLEATENYLEIRSILRNDLQELEYSKGVSDVINVINVNSGETLLSISNQELARLADNLFTEIHEASGTFTVSEILTNQLQGFLINKLKDSRSKGDINIFLHDPECGISTRKKFSIKSFIGSSPTLFNANKTTNIVYEVRDKVGASVPTALLNEINSINSHHKYIARINEIYKKGFELEYSSYQEEIFRLNLELIDAKLPEIIAFSVLEKYKNRISKITDVIDNLNAVNPLKFNMDHGHKFYEYRIINFLVEASLGMTSADVWSGVHDATGGIIIVKDTREVLCYHLIEFNKFKHYLKHASKLDNPSGGKMDYGLIYTQNDKTYIKLNFQVKA